MVKPEEMEKDITIYVNGRKKEVAKNSSLTFAQLVALAFDSVPAGPNFMFTITYTKGEGSKPEGTLVEGASVKVKDGMVFNVTATDKP